MVNLMCKVVRQVDFAPLTMNKNRNSNSAPATSPISLVRKTSRAPVRVRELRKDKANGIRFPNPKNPELVFRIMKIMLLVKFAIILFGSTK